MAARDFGDALSLQVYTELHEIASKALSGERTGHTLQPTALAHEAYLRIRALDGPAARSHGEIVALATTIVRRILIDHARRRSALRRGGHGRRCSIELIDRVEGLEPVPNAIPDDEDLLQLDEALCRLEALDPRKATVVHLRFFGGLTLEQIAEQLGLTVRTIGSEWSFARAWLHRELTHG